MNSSKDNIDDRNINHKLVLATEQRDTPRLHSRRRVNPAGLVIPVVVGDPRRRYRLGRYHDDSRRSLTWASPASRPR